MAPGSLHIEEKIQPPGRAALRPWSPKARMAATLLWAPSAEQSWELHPGTWPMGKRRGVAWMPPCLPSKPQ